MNLPQNSFFLWEILFFIGFLLWISSSYFFIGLRGVIGTFLLNGLRTEFKRISTFGRWHSGDNGCEDGCEDEVCYLCYMNLNIIGMELLYKELTDKILAAAYQVHRELGCGFLEKVYQEALAVVLSEMGIPFEREKPLDIVYHGKTLACKYVADFVIDNKVILELKAVTDLDTSCESQVINYLKVTGYKVGFLMNFGNRSFHFRRLVRY